MFMTCELVTMLHIVLIYLYKCTQAHTGNRCSSTLLINLSYKYHANLISQVIKHIIGNSKQLYNQTAKEIQDKTDKFMSS